MRWHVVVACVAIRSGLSPLSRSAGQVHRRACRVRLSGSRRSADRLSHPRRRFMVAVLAAQWQLTPAVACAVARSARCSFFASSGSLKSNGGALL